MDTLEGDNKPIHLKRDFKQFSEMILFIVSVVLLIVSEIIPVYQRGKIEVKKITVTCPGRIRHKKGTSPHLVCAQETRTQRSCFPLHRITENNILGEELMTFRLRCALKPTILSKTI